MNKLEIKIKDLSPLWVKVISVVIFMATAYKIITLTFFDVSPVVYLVLNGIAVAIWTGKELVIIDYENSVVGEGFRLLGITYLDKTKFSGLEKIYINSVRSSETFRHLTRSIDIHHHNYKAFLKTVEGEKICVGIDTDKDELIIRLKKYNEVLNVDIFDNTQVEPIIV